MPLCLVILDERLEFLGTVEELCRGKCVSRVDVYNDVGIATKRSSWRECAEHTDFGPE